MRPFLARLYLPSLLQVSSLLFPFLFLAFMAFKSFLTQWNCRSVRANGHWLRSSPDLYSQIICLQETFLSPLDSVTLPHMTQYRADRLHSRGGGLLTAVSSSLPSYQLHLPTCTDPSLEALGVSIFYDKEWVTVINIYSPSGTFQEDWLNDIVSSCDSPLIILGDFNINLLPQSPSQSGRSVNLLDWISSQDLCLLNLDHPTRTGPSGHTSLIDLTMLSPSIYNKIRFYVHPDQFDSDHHPILLLSPSPVNKFAPSKSPRWIKAAETLNKLPALPVTTYQDFTSLCAHAIDVTSTPRIPTNRQYCPWWDATCRSLLRQKRKYLRTARSRCSRTDWVLYKQFSAKLRRYIKFAARRFWDEVCSVGCSTGRIFKTLKRLAARDTPHVDNIIRNPAPLTTIQDQALAFLQYFSRDSCGQPIPVDLSSENPELDARFTFAELKTALKNTSPTTPGADGISVRLLKNLADNHLNTLLDTFNSIFDSGDLPATWKLATIIPIRKPGKKADLVSSFRPIALTPVLCKVFERMLLRRLLAWSGQNHLFHPDHFGFLPTRDCTIALCTFLHDIISARIQNHFVAAICLDIKAAYDSVCPEILTYKLASLGIGGKTGRWLASFVHFRFIQIRWKTFISTTAHCFRGVPQGSVLSPFLFHLYMRDIDETLEEGVRMIVYADDILLYVTDPDEDRARRKIQDTLARIHTWCMANELTIEPSKCTAINFTRRRDPGDPLRLLGEELEWSSPIKILGVWFSRTLCFTPHFETIKIKAHRRINYLKAVTARSRGATSHHMLRLIDSLIRSCLEYGAPLFFDSPPTALRILETCYNACIRLATGLPSWTPLPVLRREAGVSSITSRLGFLTKTFLIRLLSSPPGIRLGEIIRSILTTPNLCWKWWTPLQDLSLTVGGPLTQILRYHWPPPPCSLHLRIVTNSLPFQDTSLPNTAIVHSWYLWLASSPSGTIFATDASKDAGKTAIAAVDVRHNTAIASLIPHSNSVFTAEALAINLALSSLPITSPDITVFSDSLSVLSALENWSFKSPAVILLLVHTIHRLNRGGHSIQLIWCPGHRGIPPNEKADILARHGPFTRTVPWISPEDARNHVRTDWTEEINYSWINSDYAISNDHLLPDRQFAKWITSRSVDVDVARWRSRTIITHQRLHRMHLTYSPLCNFCYDLETPEHILLTCPKLQGPRSTLFRALSLRPPITYSAVLHAAVLSPRNLNHFITFSKLVFTQP